MDGASARAEQRTRVARVKKVWQLAGAGPCDLRAGRLSSQPRCSSARPERQTGADGAERLMECDATGARTRLSRGSLHHCHAAARLSPVPGPSICILSRLLSIDGDCCRVLASAVVECCCRVLSSAVTPSGHGLLSAPVIAEQGSCRLLLYLGYHLALACMRGLPQPRWLALALALALLRLG